MDLSTVDCLILASLYLVFHVYVMREVSKNHSKGVRK